MISERIRYRIIQHNHTIGTTFEHLTAKICLRSNQKVLISSIYRPPNTPEAEFIDEYSKFVCILKRIENKGIIVGLDHNLDLLKEFKHGPTERFLNTNLALNLIPTITRPTRITKSTATLIDNIFISQHWLSNYVSGVLVDDISDHLPSITMVKNLKVSKRELITITSRDTWQKNVTALKASLAAINWQNLITPNAPNTNMTLLHDKLAEEIDHFTPVKTHTVNPKKARREPWLTTGIYISIRKSKKLYLETLHSDASEVTRTRYSNYAKQLQRVKRKAKLSYYEDKCRLFKHNTKKLWGIINEICKSKNDKSCLIDCLKINDVLEYDAKKITNKFGECFSSVGKTFANKVKQPTKGPNDYSGKIPLNNKSLFMTPCSQKEILELIQKLPAKTSSGYDNISNVLLKDIGYYIVSPLTVIFNESLMMGIFPDVMKLADVVPLYKAKEKFLETNYRPISLLTTMSKILEKVVYNRVYKFLNDNDQLYENQYRFRNQHSCDNAVCDVVSHLVKNLEASETSVALFLDLSKAFDTLDHDLLLHKMERYGLRGVVLDWFRSYLHDRKLRVKCKPTSSGQIETSAEFPIKYGTPQGSCLGPLLFLIFCNDLCLNLSYLHCVQFADDTTLLLGHKNHRYLKYCVESDLAIVQDWFNANKLTLNINKSTFMIFSPNHTKTCELEITLNGITLPRTNNTKFLGTWIDEKLVWSHHLKNLRTKLLSKLGLLRKIAP